MESAIPGWEQSRQTVAALRGDTGDDLLARLVHMFEESEEASQAAREEAEKARDYYDGNQLDDKTRRDLQARGQPEIIINRIKRKIDYLLGYERATRTDPKAYPRTMNDQGAAEAATDALRFVCDHQRFDTKRSAVWENMLVEGFGGVEIGARMNARGEIEPTITHVPWDRIFFDPHARRPDFSDARYVGIVLWLDEEEAIERWPEAAGLITSQIDAAPLSSTYDDKPTRWADRRRRRIRVVQMYYLRRATWHLCFFTRGGMLREAEPVPYLDEDGQPECPLVLQSAYIDRDLDRYGVVREMVGPQDEVNKRRSKALHLISVRQTVGEKGAVDDVKKAKQELARPDGHIEVNAGLRFELLDTSDMAAAQFQLLQESKQEIDLLGPNASMMGKDDKAPSGRAIALSQQGGSIELGPLTDNLRQWQWRVFEQLWHRIKQYWRAEKWIRVTDDETNLRWVGLNRPITLAEEIAQDPAAQSTLEQMRAQVMEQAQMSGQLWLIDQFEAEIAQQLAQVVDTSNDVARMDVDISLMDAPDTVTLQSEQFEQLVQLAQALPGAIPPDLLIEMSALRTETKQPLLEKLRAPPQPDPAVQAANEATVRKTQSEAARNEAQALKAQTEAQALAAGAPAAAAQGMMSQPPPLSALLPAPATLQ